MPRLKNKWLEKEKEPIAAIPVSVVAPITPQYLNIEQASAYLSVTRRSMCGAWPNTTKSAATKHINFQLLVRFRRVMRHFAKHW
jgi:hypothetical protein